MGRRCPGLEQSRNSQIAQHLTMQAQEVASPPHFWLDLAHPVLHWASNRMERDVGLAGGEPLILHFPRVLLRTELSEESMGTAAALRAGK